MKKYRWVVDLAILTLLAILVSDTALVWIRHRLTPPWRPALVKSTETKAADLGKFAVDHGVILQRNLFAAEVEPPPAPKPGAATEAPLPPLNLRLIGTIDLTDGEAKAILEDKTTKRQGLYRRGERIGAAQLLEIERRQVVLLNGSRRETLSLSEEIVTIPAPSAQGKPAAGPEARLAPGGLRANGSDTIQKVGEDTWVVDQARTERAVGNVNQFLANVRILPYFEKGKQSGFMVSQIPPGSLLSQAGLTNGDIIRKINEVEVASPAEAFKSYQQMKSGATVTVEVQRNRKIEVFTYQFK